MKEGSTNRRDLLPAGFFALLFFFGCADLIFATRMHGMNFRWGQLLLIAGALLSAGPLITLLRQPGEQRRTVLRILGGWALFFGALALSAVHSDERRATFIKLCWAIVNIAGAAVVCLAGACTRTTVLEGFAVATGLTSAVVWVDSLVMFWGDLPGPVLGNAQLGWMFNGVQPMRPHAYYYEPSYAGAMLAFATPLLFVATTTLPRWVQTFVPALAMSAVVLIGARTGFLGVVLSVGLCFGWALLRREWAAVRRVGASVGVAALMLVIFFSAAPRASAYASYLIGPLGVSASARRMAVVVTQPTPVARPRTSEGARLESIIDGLRHWRQRPLLGWGVNNGTIRAVGPSESDRAIHTGAPNTWVEVLVESGVLGLLMFLLAIGGSLWAVLRARPRAPLWGFLIAACVTHFCVDLNMTQTFPRLDYWLLFFCLVRAALPEAEPQVAVDTRPVTVPVADVASHPAPAAEA